MTLMLLLNFLSNLAAFKHVLFEFKVLLNLLSNIWNILEREKICCQCKKITIILISFVILDRNSVGEMDCKTYGSVINNYYIFDISIVQKLYQVLDLMSPIWMRRAALPCNHMVKVDVVLLDNFNYCICINVKSGREEY